MSRPVAPKHRAPRAGLPSPSRPSRGTVARHRAERPVASRSRALLAPATAIAAAGLAVTAGVTGVSSAQTAASSPDTAGGRLVSDLTAAATTFSAEDRAALTADRAGRASRSDRRTGADRREATRPGAETDSGGQATRTEEPESGDPRQLAREMLPAFGFSSDQFSCLDALWTKESGWDVHADNPTSSAYGIPQALPGSKMASAGADWATNPSTQIRWGLGYIASSYGSPCAAWGHSQSHNWY